MDKKLLEHQKKSRLLKSDDVKEVIEICKTRCIEISTTGIDDKELRGMLRLLNWITGWEDDLDKYIKQQKSER